ncbi:MAG: heat-inducible transcriptional repressor HrcA [Candidatus Aminicenantes bacterium]|nr:heat-inducible transcriptional repressor HrcA [Candidatus Aminicenantes bacterium]
MTHRELQEKEQKVLRLIVEDYLKVGHPVSSSAVAVQCDFSVSPATVRHIMSRLEQEGYLAQPHTSAGRIPTDEGLRFYINLLFDDLHFPQQAKSIAPGDFDIEQGDFFSMLHQVSSLLAEYSDNLGFVLSPRLSQLNFKHIRFLKIGEEKILIILITTFDLVLTEIAPTRNYFTQRELDSASRFINENFRSKNLLYIRDYLLKELPKYRNRYEDSVGKLTSLLKNYIFMEESRKQVFLQGTSKLLNNPELFEMDHLRTLFNNFEEKAKLAKLLSDFISLDRVKVIIGSELNIPDIEECALILSHYGYDRQILGSLGIIGPKRLSYKRIIPLVDIIAQKLSKTISSS